MKLKDGQQVCHSQYGWGTVLECDRHQTMVCFRTVGVKRLVTSPKTFKVVGIEARKKEPVV
ncbi:MAG: hypothetical protein LAN62_12805 [Acidobacteriia bacterium]|nr:hypothetical protein [Terriglobia bacterium]